MCHFRFYIIAGREYAYTFSSMLHANECRYFDNSIYASPPAHFAGLLVPMIEIFIIDEI